MKIGVIGAKGNLGSSLVSLLHKNRFSDRLFTSDIKSDFQTRDWNDLNRSNLFSNEEVFIKSNVIFLCVKPNDMTGVLSEIQKLWQGNNMQRNKLLVSCAAGFALQEIQKYVTLPTFRCMMNIPISLGEGVICYTGNQHVNHYHYQMLNKLLNGPKLYWTEKENDIDITTILTACMPAYIAYFSKAYIKFGLERGMEYDDVIKLYTETVKSTMNLLKEHPPNQIINMVSSPQGITKYGLDFLDLLEVKTSIDRATSASYYRLKLLQNKKD